VVINYGDFSRFVKSESHMKWGNFLGLPVSLAFFSFLALFITAGTAVLFGEIVTNPAEMVAKVDNLALTVIAALTFFAATVGINLVANFIPAAFGLANLAPAKISARTGGIITAVISFFIGALWLALISKIGIAGFVDTLGAVLAPLYGIVVADYYLVRKQRLNVQDGTASAQNIDAQPCHVQVKDTGGLGSVHDEEDPFVFRKVGDPPEVRPVAGDVGGRRHDHRPGISLQA